MSTTWLCKKKAKHGEPVPAHIALQPSRVLRTLPAAYGLLQCMLHSVPKAEGEQEGKSKVKSPPKAMSLYVGPSNTVLPVVPKSLLNWPCVFGLVCFFPNCLKILFFKKRIKKQKLHALEIKVQCIQWLYSCLLISCVGTPIFKTFCIKFVKPL